MSSGSSRRSLNILNDQIIAGIVLERLKNRAFEQAQAIETINLDAASQIARSNDAFSRASEFLEDCRDYVSPANRLHILGPEGTKHGEIAEQLEVNFRNGRDVLNRLEATAKVLSEGSERIGPIDYLVDGGVPVQSKYIGGGNNSLRHILDHLKKYPGYAQDTTPYGFPGKRGIYHMPKDQYDFLERIRTGDTQGIHSRTVTAAKKLIDEIEKEANLPFNEVVKPGLNSYGGVQLGKVDETINKEGAFYSEIHKNDINTIREEQKNQLDNAQHITDASWSEAFRAIGIAAAISSITSAGIRIRTKFKEGKRFADFDLDDWKDVGCDFAKGAGKGGISGAAIYGLTKLGGFEAPFAGGITSSAIGVTSLFIDYKKGLIDESDFADSANALCFEAGLASVGAAVGQALIPIPVIGSIVGSMTAQAALMITKQLVGEKEMVLIAKMQSDYDSLVKKLNVEEAQEIASIKDYYDRLGGLIEASMHAESNLRLSASIRFAIEMGVMDKDIIHNESELNDLIRS